MPFNLIEKEQVVLSAKENALAIVTLIVDVVLVTLFEYHN